MPTHEWVVMASDDKTTYDSLQVPLPASPTPGLSLVATILLCSHMQLYCKNYMPYMHALHVWHLQLITAGIDQK